MKKSIFRLPRFATASAPAPADSPADSTTESAFFSTTLATRGTLRVNTPLVPWQTRAIEIGATSLPILQGSEQLAQLWVHDPYMKILGAQSLLHLGLHFEYARTQADQDVIRQNEFSRFMVVVLSGDLSVEREQASGGRTALAQTRNGDILGEMSLLDGGPRFSSCRSLNECDLAILSAEALDRLLQQEPVLAAQTVALLARRLSMQLRPLSSRFINEPHT